MLEVLIAAVILAFILAALGSTFIISKKHSMHSVGRVTAANLAREYLNNLALDVRSDEWNSRCLGNNATCSSNSNVVLDDILQSTAYYHYNETYDTRDHPDTSTIRVASVNITWSEIVPK